MKNKFPQWLACVKGNTEENSDSVWNTTENKQAWILENPGKNITDWNPIGKKEEWIGWGEDILTLAVMSILITAPFGAIFILALGPKFLDADEGYAKDFTRSMSQRHSHKDKENVSDL